jgi:hypothetical protein
LDVYSCEAHDVLRARGQVKVLRRIHTVQPYLSTHDVLAVREVPEEAGPALLRPANDPKRCSRIAYREAAEQLLAEAMSTVIEQVHGDTERLFVKPVQVGDISLYCSKAEAKLRQVSLRSQH